MVTLLKRRLRKKEEETPNEIAPTQEPDRDRILLLVPVEGGFSFQLYAFPTVQSVAAYVENHFPFRADHLVVFRAAHELPSHVEAAETVVLVRDLERPGIVHLYSFVDMETAYAFIRSEAMRGLVLNCVLLFWAEPVSLSGEAPVREPESMSGPPPTVLTQWHSQAEQAAPFQLQPIAPVELPQVPHRPEPDPLQPGPALEMPEKEPLRGEPNPFLTAGRGAAHAETFSPFAPPPVAPDTPATPFTPIAPPTVADPFAPRAVVVPEPTLTAPPAAEHQYDPATKHARRGYVNVPGAPAEPAPAQAVAKRPAAQGGLDGLFHRVRGWDGWDGLGPHMLNAMRLRWQTYDDVRKDEYATGRAWVMAGTAVAASALAAAGQGPAAFFAHGLLAAIGAAVFTGLIYVFGTLVFGGKLNEKDFDLFLQRLGLAAAPGFLLVLGALPIYGPLFLLGALLWIMATSIKATELSLELDRQSAAYTVIFAWLALFAVAAVLPNLLV